MATGRNNVHVVVVVVIVVAIVVAVVVVVIGRRRTGGNGPRGERGVIDQSLAVVVIWRADIKTGILSLPLVLPVCGQAETGLKFPNTLKTNKSRQRRGCGLFEVLQSLPALQVLLGWPASVCQWLFRRL